MRRAAAMVVAELVIALPAFPGGVGLMRDGLSMNPGWVSHTLFPDWTIPGLLLFAIIGCGTLAAAVGTVLRRRLASPLALAAGIVLLVWLAAETLMIGWHGGPQLALDGCYGGLGVLLVILALPQTSVVWGSAATADGVAGSTYGKPVTAATSSRTVFSAGSDGRRPTSVQTGPVTRSDANHWKGAGNA